MADKERQLPEMQPDDTPQPGAKSPLNTSAGTAMPPELQGAIGKQLKQVYGKMLQEPLPDKFAKLLSELGKTDK